MEGDTKITDSCFNEASIIDNHKLFLGEMREKIFNFIYDNQKEIKIIYKKIMNNDYGNLHIKVVDANLLIHKYNEYLNDMLEAIDELSQKSPKGDFDTIKLCKKMIKRDRGYYDSIAEPSDFIVSEAMQNIETLIYLKSFIEKSLDVLNTKLCKLECEDENLRGGLIAVYTSSVSTFLTKIIEDIFKTFEEISSITETGIKLALESTKSNPRPYKMF